MNRCLVLPLCVCTIMLLSLHSTCSASADDHWPTWRGPHATGAAVRGNPPVTWNESENIKWKVEVPGAGSSSPVIWADRIFFLTAVPTETQAAATQEPPREQASAAGGGRGRRGRRGGMSRPPTTACRFEVVCMNRRDGKILWQRIAREGLPHEGHHPTGSFASYSAVTDGKHVWASFGSRGVHCHDINGEHNWSRDLGKMNKVMSFGEGSSPAVIGDALIVVMDHEGDSFTHALNKQTGEILWSRARDEGTSWATPVGVEVDGKMQVITSATNRVRSYDLETGDLVWECAGQTRNVIPTPVIGFDKVFCTSGFRGSALQAIKLGHKGDLTDSHAVAWAISDGTPYVPSPLLYGDKIYFCSVNRAVISCYQADTGKANFVKQPLEGMRDIYASPIGVANRVYFAGRDGACTVIKHSDKLEILATNTLDDGFDASPAVVGDELYLKGKKYFYCIAKQ